ncbi:tail fiber domain-containing protein [Emticicia fontis]
MKKSLQLLCFLLLSTTFVYSQSATILPDQSDFVNASSLTGAYAIKGVMSNKDGGVGSVALRGMNNSTSNAGMGIWGSHDGGGYGVFGTSITGKAVFGSSTSGVAVYGSSANGNAGVFEITGQNSTAQGVKIVHAGWGTGLDINLLNSDNSGRGINVTHSGSGTGVFSNSNGGNGVWGITSSLGAAGVIGDNMYGEAVVGRSKGGLGVGAVVGRSDSTGYGVRGFNTKNGIGVLGQCGINSGTGVGGRFENVNSSNPSTALEAFTNGAGAAAYFTNTHITGGGAGLVVTKNSAYSGAYTNNPKADLEVRHASEITTGMSGLRILNTSANKSWTLYTVKTNGNLNLYADGVYRGSFNAATGSYTPVSDARLKVDIRNYTNTLDNLLKIAVKTYKGINSDKTEIGLIAQEVAVAFPEIVYSNTNDKGEQFYTMDYSRIGVLAVKAIQEQQLIIENQQKEIEILKKQVKSLESLKAEIEQIKKQINK